MVLSGDLTRYAIKRASSMDVAAVARCRDMLSTLHGKLLEFDFRNGPLRKKYDGVSASFDGFRSLAGWRCLLLLHHPLAYGCSYGR